MGCKRSSRAGGRPISEMAAAAGMRRSYVTRMLNRLEHAPVPARRSIGRNSAPGSASSEPHPARNTANARRPQKAEGDLVSGRDARRAAGARTVPRERRKEIFGISEPQTRDSVVSRDREADAHRPLNARKESRIPHHRKSKKYCYINYLSRGGAGSLERTRLRRIPC